MKLLINNEELEYKLLTRDPEKVVFLLEDEEFSFTLEDLSNESISILSKNEKLNLPIQEINQETLLTNAFGVDLKIEKVLPNRKKQLKNFYSFYDKLYKNDRY